MKKYVIQNLNFAAPYPGNLMRSIFKLASECKSENIEFIYFFPKEAKRLYWVENMIDEGCIVYFKSGKNVLFQFIRLVREYKPIAIHTHFWGLKEYFNLRILKLKYPSIKLILHHHSVYIPSSNKIKEKIKKIILRNDVNIACSNAMYDDLTRLKFNNVVLAENAIEFSRLDNFSKISREDYEIDDNSRIYLMFGHAFELKGVDIAVLATELLEKEKNAVLCIVVSNSIDEKKKEIEGLLGYFPDWIRLLTARDDISTYYNFADVFLSPSRHEGFCYAIVEAAYAGCRVIFSDIPGQAHAKDIPDILYFETENSEDLKNKMLDASEPFDYMKAKEYVVKRYSLSKWCEQIMKEY